MTVLQEYVSQCCDLSSRPPYAAYTPANVIKLGWYRDLSVAIVTECGTFPLSASRNEYGRASDENVGLSLQIVFLSLTWPILKEIPECESAVLQRTIILAWDSRDPFSDGNTTGCCEQRSARKGHFAFEVPLSPQRGDGNLYRDSHKIPPEENFISPVTSRRATAYKQLSLNTQKCLDVQGKRCYPRWLISVTKNASTWTKRQASTQTATTQLQRCHRSRQWHVCGSLAEGPSSNVAAIDRYWPKCAKKKYFRRFVRASSTSHTHPQMSTRPGSNRPLLYTCHARFRPRPSTTTHQTQPGKKYVPWRWFVVAFSIERISYAAERSRSLSMFVETTIVWWAMRIKVPTKYVIIKITY